MIYLLYGQPGTGKSTLATGLALQYAREGRRVAANFPIDFSPASVTRKGRLASASVTVLPLRPDVGHLLSLGLGWHDLADRGREDRAGVLIIDESGPWLNSRTWNDKQRSQVIDWFLHSRKRGWDVVLIAQAPGLLDKQIREAVIEGYARCRRLDRVKFAGFRLPRLHIAVARYGLDPHAPILERWAYRGSLEHKCFASYALFDAEGDQVDGPYSTLPARITKWGAGYRTMAERQIDAARALLARLRGVFAPAPRPALRPKRPEVAALMALPPERRLALLRQLSPEPPLLQAS